MAWWKHALAVIFFVVVVFLLGLYWIIPLGSTNFQTFSSNPNFLLNNSNQSMQFYPNMRYPSSQISYKIYPCPIDKVDSVKRAFQRIENQTSLVFYPVSSNEEISVTCNDTVKIDNGLFIAGEGGPVNITRSGSWNVILKGDILLLRNPSCSQPNVATHELLHALGFNHSKNPSNLMYPVSKCSQTLGQDIPNLINKLYSYPSQPDLTFENASASKTGGYIDMNVTIRNIGLNNAGDSTLIISADGKQIKSVPLKPLDIGEGRMIFLQNMLVLKSVNELELNISYPAAELNKTNNNIKLQVKS